MNEREKQRGAALLLEAVLALGLVGLSIGSFFLLHQRNLRRTSQARDMEVAAFIGARLYSEAKAWSSQYHRSHSFSDWSLYNGVTHKVEFEGFQVVTKVEPLTLYSPCSDFEELYDPSEQRTIVKSAKRLVVEIRWGGNEQLNLSYLVGLPTLPLGSTELQVSADGNTSLGRDGSVMVHPEFANTTRDELSDLFFTWAVRGNGNGRLQVSHSSREVKFSNYVLLPPDDRKYYTGLDCKLVLKTRYAGRTLTAHSRKFELAK